MRALCLTLVLAGIALCLALCASGIDVAFTCGNVREAISAICLSTFFGFCAAGLVALGSQIAEGK